jgi:hypothetical protein
LLDEPPRDGSADFSAKTLTLKIARGSVNAIERRKARECRVKCGGKVIFATRKALASDNVHTRAHYQDFLAAAFGPPAVVISNDADPRHLFRRVGHVETPLATSFFEG